MGDRISPRLPVLVVDDEPAILATFRRQFHRSGYDLTLVRDGEEALRQIKDRHYELVVTDLKLPGMDGMELLSRIKHHDPTIDVIIITGYESLDSAIEAIRLQACDYIVKPIDFEYMRLAVDRTIEHKRLLSENVYLRSRLEGDERYGDFIGVSKSVRQVHEIIDRAAATDSTVLIQGETGTGKELVAETIHNLSPRSPRPFTVVNCGAIVETLMESELFGHVQGAFTGANSTRKGLFRAASGGTIFLDEITEMQPGIQAKLLRTIEQRKVLPVGSDKEFEVDVRIVAATNQYTDDALNNGNLRRDFFYRLNVVPISVPPLRERKEDIPVLIRRFIHNFNRTMGRKVEGVSSDALEALVAYHWPGNVRELRNVIERAFSLGRSEIINMEDLPDDLMVRKSCPDEPFVNLMQTERDQILKALKMTAGDKKHASELLGIDRSTLYRKMKRLGISTH